MPKKQVFLLLSFLILVSIFILVCVEKQTSSESYQYIQNLGDSCKVYDPSQSCGENATCTGPHWYSTSGTCQCNYNTQGVPEFDAQNCYYHCWTGEFDLNDC